METLTIVLIAVFGLVLGSFLNVVIYRLPRDLNLATPPSSCPGCGSRIKPYDNVPLLSYLVLRGKCRACGQKISPVYPAVETLTAAGFVLVFLAGGRVVDLQFAAGCVFTAALIVLGFIDYFHQILPDAVTMPGLVLFLAYSFVRPVPSFRAALVGAVTGAVSLLLVYGVYFLVRKKEGLGMGDVTMMLMVGAYLGASSGDIWRGLLKTVLTLILGSLAGALVGIYIIVRKKKDLQFALPFGTFLAPAAFVAALWGDKIVTAYLNLFKR